MEEEEVEDGAEPRGLVEPQVARKSHSWGRVEFENISSAVDPPASLRAPVLCTGGNAYTSLSPRETLQLSPLPTLQMASALFEEDNG